ncbi:unnamed protein product [Haemonchus placei]|uniref:PKcGMP_CC domain-containing protein n=1 Tax=Haemonchus placei TaxID=6290 RepID=A0A0N4WS02_HAEPC|nr:unnamed protein product [Haemonchus placei]
MSDENGVPENSEDEAAAAGYVVGNGKLPIGTSELEQEIKELENLLRLEREERRRIQAEAQVSHRQRQALFFLRNLFKLFTISPSLYTSNSFTP